MRGSTVTTARSCLQPLVSVSRYLAIKALTGDPIYFIVKLIFQTKSKVKELYTQTCQQLGQQGMQDCELFGLAILSDGEYLFIDPDSKLNKYAPKKWRNSQTYGLDSTGRPAFVLFFRVRYYVDTPFLLSDQNTRHHYYLQLRDNIIRHGEGIDGWQGLHPLQSVTVYFPLLALAGLALQADFGDYNEERHGCRTQVYCKPCNYLPAHMCMEKNVLSALVAQHRNNCGLSQKEAELSYIREAVLLEAPLNAHLYKLRRSKCEQGPGRALLAICARGLRIYGEKRKPQVFNWNSIGKLGFDRKKFEIRAVDHPCKVILFSSCGDKSKLLLALCRDTHQFFMAIAPRVIEAKHREEEESKILRDCYMYPAHCKLSWTARSSKADQRISLISTTFSTTTSSIVSDRVHSENEPGAGHSSNDFIDDSIASTTIDNNLKIKSAIYSTEFLNNPTLSLNSIRSSVSASLNSQSTSTCSTVILNYSEIGSDDLSTGSTTAGLFNVAVAAIDRRRFLTSNNSHLEHNFSNKVQSTQHSGKEACKRSTDIGSKTSGVYKLSTSISEILESQIETTHDVSAQSTTDEASVTSGFYSVYSSLNSEKSESGCNPSSIKQELICCSCQNDNDSDQSTLNNRTSEKIIDVIESKERVRSRSHSIISNNSFRGDGSDPSNDQGPLLSARELSDLIVGRYPQKKSMVTNLESSYDCVDMLPPTLQQLSNNKSKRQLRSPPFYSGSVLQKDQPFLLRQSTNYVHEQSEIPPPTPPRNDAVMPREPPPPPSVNTPTNSGDKMKPTSVHAPVSTLVVSPNNYLDIHATRKSRSSLPYFNSPRKMHYQIIQRQALLPPSLPSTSFPLQTASPPPRLPPPLPPDPLDSPSMSQVAKSQIQQYEQQLYSDVDYVVFPLKDPEISEQEYMDAKEGSLIAAMAYYTSSSPNLIKKSSIIYKSTPYLAYPSSFSSSNQNLTSSLTDTNSIPCEYPGRRYAESTSSLYSGLSCNSGHEYLNSPAALPPSSPPPICRCYKLNTTKQLGLSRSHEDILASCDCTTNSLLFLSHLKDKKEGSMVSSSKKHKPRRLPPPLLLPSCNTQKISSTHALQPLQWSRTLDRKTKLLWPHFEPPKTQAQLPSTSQQAHLTQLVSELRTPPYEYEHLENIEHQQEVMLDIKSLREKSRNLDLPLISALCNDRYLLKQTKAFLLPKYVSNRASNSGNNMDS